MLKRTGIVAILLSLALLISACGNSETVQSPTKAELAARYGVEEEEIDAYHVLYPQIKAEGLTISDNFAEGRVMICVYQFAYEYSFRPSDFTEIGCATVEDLFGPYEKQDHPTRWLILTLEDESKESVVDAIEILLERADIYCAEPDYIMSIS